MRRAALMRNRTGRPERILSLQQTAAFDATRATGPSRSVRALVRERDAGRCVRCGRTATDMDHRQGRGAGGRHGALRDLTNGPAWLLTLCGNGNTSGCHGWRETHRHEAERYGYRIPRNGVTRDATAVPVRTETGWALFTHAGERLPCLPPPGGDARDCSP